MKLKIYFFVWIKFFLQEIFFLQKLLYNFMELNIIHMMRRSKLPPSKLPTGGQPTRIFTEEQLQQVELLSKLGATNHQFAMFFGVDVSTIERWCRTHEEFNHAKKRGGIEADMKVVGCLFKRATGYTYTETESIFDPKTGTRIVTKTHEKHLVPDTKAQIYWLKIHQREFWVTTPEFVHHHTGKINHLHQKLEEIPVNELTKEAQKLVFEIASKQLSNVNRDN